MDLNFRLVLHQIRKELSCISFKFVISFLEFKKFLQFTQKQLVYTEILSSKWRPFEEDAPCDAYLAYRVAPPLTVARQFCVTENICGVVISKNGLSNTLWTKKDHFTVRVSLNSHNCRIWAIEILRTCSNSIERGESHGVVWIYRVYRCRSLFPRENARFQFSNLA